MSERRKFGTLQKEMELVTEELKKSGTWTPPAGCKKVDAFLVGGGGGGSTYSNSNCYGDGYEGGEEGVDYGDANGGGGGYTKTFYDISVTPGTPVSFTIGAGGRGAYSHIEDNGQQGGYTQFKNSSYKVEGGYPGITLTRNNPESKGGDGGSGGGAAGGKGGTNGSNGKKNRSNATVGNGQGYSTKCPFDGYSSRVFSGGGGSAGASAGYGSGGDSSAGNSSYESGTSGKANTGGGGAGKWGGETGQAGSGGSGIIILRYYKYKE